MAADTRSITPAHLDYLSIFSPDLAEDEQLVFHYSKPPRRRRSEKEPKDTQDKDAAEARAQQEQHRRMRQIGLAQGMVGFARYGRARLWSAHGWLTESRPGHSLAARMSIPLRARSIASC